MDEDHNLHVELARLKKAQRLIAIIDVSVGVGDWGTSQAAAERMTEGQWLGIALWDAQLRNPKADLSRIHAPSLETRDEVIKLLRGRMRIQRQLERQGVLR